MKRLRIYVAGPYTGRDREEIDLNVTRAIDAGIEVYLRGHYPYVPHLTDLVDLRAKETGKKLSWHDFIQWDMPWLNLCDALLYLGNSRGADIELEEAKRLRKRIFYSVEEVPQITAREAEEEKEMATLTYWEAARRGAAYLDQKQPGWRSRVVPELLDAGSECR